MTTWLFTFISGLFLNLSNSQFFKPKPFDDLPFEVQAHLDVLDIPSLHREFKGCVESWPLRSIYKFYSYGEIDDHQMKCDSNIEKTNFSLAWCQSRSPLGLEQHYEYHVVSPEFKLSWCIKESAHGEKKLFLSHISSKKEGLGKRLIGQLVKAYPDYTFELVSAFNSQMFYYLSGFQPTEGLIAEFCQAVSDKIIANPHITSLRDLEVGGSTMKMRMDQAFKRVWLEKLSLSQVPNSKDFVNWKLSQIGQTDPQYRLMQLISARFLD